MLVFLILACCVTIIICKLISTNAHKKALMIDRRLYSTEILGEDSDTKKKSPYSLLRDMGSDEQWGYWVMENGDRLRARSGYYEIFYKLDDAKALLWELESVGGYAKTKF